MRWAALLAVLIAAGAGVAWWAVSGRSQAVRSTTTPPPPTRAELLLQKIDALEQQLVAGEEWRKQVYADPKRSAGYERPPAANQRRYTPEIRASLERLRAEPSPDVEQQVAARLLLLAVALQAVTEQSANIALLRGQTVADSIPPQELARMLTEFARFLSPPESPAPDKR